MQQLGAEIKLGKVMLESGDAIPDAEVLSKGERDSKGLLLVDSLGAKYLAIPVDDIADLKGFCDSLTAVVEMISNVPAVVGATPSAGNPQILAELTELKLKLEGFKQT